MLFADDFAAPVLQAALFPVHVPIADAAREKCGFFGCFPNLLEPLPAAPCERRCEAFNAEGFRCERRCAHARLEADEASCVRVRSQAPGRLRASAHAHSRRR